MAGEVVRRAVGCHPPVERLVAGHVNSSGTLVCPCSWYQTSCGQMIHAMILEWSTEDRVWLMRMTALVAAAML